MAAYQQGGEGVWTIQDMFSAGDRVAVRWTGTGTHVGDINGIPANGDDGAARRTPVAPLNQVEHCIACAVGRKP